MPNLSESPVWEDVYEIQATDRVAGANGTFPDVVNRPSQSLTNRTAYLKDQLAVLQGSFTESSPFLVSFGVAFLTIKAGTSINLGSGDNVKLFVANADMTLDVRSILDTGVITNGRDYYLFLCPNSSGDGFIFRVSLSKSNPLSFNPADVLLIGGFHTLCASVGSGLTYVEGGVTKSHPLNGLNVGSILPQSVWCLNHRPHSEPEGMVYIPSLDFWCDIYLQSSFGENTRSVFQGSLTRSRQYVDHVEDMFCVNKELLDDAEFAAALLGSNEMTSVNGASELAATNGGAGGRVDTAGRRMISIYGVEEGCGSLWQWLRTTSAGGRQGEMHGQLTDNPITYGWIVMPGGVTIRNGQAGGKGDFWSLAGALRAGGRWSNGSGCGSRARHADGARSSAGADGGGRGRSRPKRI